MNDTPQADSGGCARCLALSKEIELIKRRLEGLEQARDLIGQLLKISEELDRTRESNYRAIWMWIEGLARQDALLLEQIALRGAPLDDEDVERARAVLEGVLSTLNAAEKMREAMDV